MTPELPPKETDSLPEDSRMSPRKVPSQQQPWVALGAAVSYVAQGTAKEVVPARQDRQAAYAIPP